VDTIPLRVLWISRAQPCSPARSHGGLTVAYSGVQDYGAHPHPAGEFPRTATPWSRADDFRAGEGGAHPREALCTCAAPDVPFDIQAGFTPLQLKTLRDQIFAFKVSSLGDAKSSLSDAKSSLGDAKSSLGDAESSLGDAKSSLGDVKSSLGDAESSLGDAKSSLSDAKSSLGDAESSLGDTKSSLGDAKSSLGDAKSSLDDAKSSLGDAKSSLGDTKSSLVTLTEPQEKRHLHGALPRGARCAMRHAQSDHTLWREREEETESGAAGVRWG
jgi:hypothetical protein